MGCGMSKENIENEMMKAKMDRVEIQFERQKQLELLKDIDGILYKAAIIPDYLASSPEQRGKKILKKKGKISVFRKVRKTKSTSSRPKKIKSLELKINKKGNVFETFNDDQLKKKKKAFH
jgi:hypothetical protein